MPPAVLVSASAALTTTRSAKGLILTSAIIVIEFLILLNN
jgi:hypothetical protein